MQGQTTRVVLKGTYRPNGIPENENFYKIGSSTQLWSQDNLQKQVLAKAQDVLQNDTDVTVDLGSVATAKGFHALSEIDIKKADVRVSDDVYAKIATELGLSSASDKSIATYFNGQVYYIARIKHFGDADCPWNIGDPTYGGDNEKYLGRYGMVRNTGTSSTCCLYPIPVHPMYPTSSMTPPMTKTITTSRSKSTSLPGLSAYRT